MEQKNKKLIHIFKPEYRHWVGDGFHVYSMFQPSPDIYKMTNPFLMLDFAPAETFSPSANRRGVGEHPHRGFETVTFAYQGEVEHRDSSGGGGIIKAGDVQWMTAASGVVHDEFHTDDFTKSGGLFEMVQLWVNLPKEFKMSPPKYQGVKNDDFPRLNYSDNTEIKVIAGSFKNTKGSCSTFSPINIYEIDSNAGEVKLSFSQTSNTLILVLKGAIELDSQTIDKEQIAVFSKEGTDLTLKTSVDTKILVLNAEPIDEPMIAYGPFVMNTKSEIIAAYEDYNNGKMGKL